jgi:PHD/YefM family antitoxin component YafN of YafNO toxin-antitoxin module
MRLSSDEFVARFEALTAQGVSDAIIVTRDGRDRYVLISADDYAHLMGRNHDDEPAAALPETDLDSVEWNR